MKAALLAFLIWLGWFVPPQAVVITGFDPGGDVSTYLTFWDRIGQSGASVVLDGACVSACTLVTAAVPADKICITVRGSLGVHQATSEGKPDPEVTQLIQTTFYPAWLQEWIKAWEAEHGPLTTEVVYIKYDELSKHYRTCSESEAPISGDSGDA